MRWEGGRKSWNIEDRRGMGPAAVGGGIGVVVLALLGLFLFGTGLPPLALQPGGTLLNYLSLALLGLGFIVGWKF